MPRKISTLKASIKNGLKTFNPDNKNGFSKAKDSFSDDFMQENKKSFKINTNISNKANFQNKEGNEQVYNDLSISSDDFGSLISKATAEVKTQKKDDEKKEEFKAFDAPVIKLVNSILTKAITNKVSDIHFEPFENSFQIRYRLDGSLYKVMNLPIAIKNAVISRIKILAELDIAEKRIPQDGRIKLKFKNKKAIDFRVSTLPVMFGESLVIRIFDKTVLNIDLEKLGLEPLIFESLKRCISHPYGLLLVTGPTGSGKTTTLYSILNRLNKSDTKILTIEDPVEFYFKGINQVSVKEEANMTFPVALRAFLRQDPDIIMIGEIRDIETAKIAIKAAMTGHLVFATLHTNDCPSTITRLIDLGIPSYLLASCITMVLSQRLVRKLCPKCQQIDDKSSSQKLELCGFSKDEIKNLKIFKDKGCKHCSNTGYTGRAGLFELMEVSENISKLINENASEENLRKTAIKEGMITLREAGLQKVRKQQTSIDEVVKRTNLTRKAK